ncbi:MAG: HEAT repeat domain-containing protein, partial [Gemmatimonadaceae bacterium]|nr:HEAT repeat domain-containing protein [Gemmatimonadaceae bacterium]
MDRHAEFATQLSHLIALYSREPVDHAAERSALRAARGAAKHGAVELSVIDGVLKAGAHELDASSEELSALLTVLAAVEVARLTVAHQAKQEEIKRLAQLLAPVLAGTVTASTGADQLFGAAWKEMEFERAVVETMADGEAGAPTAEAAPAPDETPEAPTPAVPSLEAPSPEAPSLEVPSQNAPTPAEQPVEEQPAETESLAAFVPGKPLAESLPDDVVRFADDEHRPLFDALIAANEPLSLRRLLEPVQAAIERAARDGRVLLAARLVICMIACERCAEDTEMRRPFVVTIRRLTKPTLIRAFATQFADAPDSRGELAQVLERFGEDGAEAVADCVGSAPTSELRALYTALLARLPEANDALLGMLDDDRPLIVERTLGLMVELRHPELERVLGEQLGSERLRARVAAARGLSALADSSFAADALVRAVQDPAPEVRLVAAVGLHTRREERIVPALLPLLDTEEELEVQLALVASLGKIVTADGVQKLIALANPTERMLRRRGGPLLRLSAIEALGEARTPAAMGALQK